MTHGIVLRVVSEPGAADVLFVHGSRVRVTHREAQKALLAMSASPPREIKIVESSSRQWEERIVEILPLNLVKARGLVAAIRRDFISTDEARWEVEVRVNVAGQSHKAMVGKDGVALAAQAMIDGEQVEIVSVYGSTDLLRKVP